MSTKKILVVDDDPDSRRLVSDVLEMQHYHVVSVELGQKALNYMHEQIPDLVILDVNMPDMTGLQVTRNMRTSPTLSQVPIILFTGRDHVNDKIAGFEAGADDYLTKPIHPVELINRVRAALTLSRTASSEND